MIRVAYVLKKFPRLSETFILTELLALEERGVPLVVYSLRLPDDPRFHPELGRLRAEIRYVAPGSFADALARAVRGEPDAPARERAVLRLLRLASDPDLAAGGQEPASRLEEAALAARVAELARADGVTHLHAHFATIAARVAHLASGLAGIPYSVTGHAKDLYRAGVNARLLDRLAAGSRAFVTVCDANVEHLRSTLTAAGFGNVRRVYNGIDVDSFAALARPRAAGEDATPALLAVGRLVRKKGLHVLLDALAALRRGGRATSLRIVGEGPERAALASQADALGLGDSVAFLGAQPSDAVRRELAETTLCCLPCVPDADGNQDALPTVLLEAMAAGVPCVSTRLGGIPEILDHGRAGVLVEPGDAQALADAIAALIDDSGERERLGSAGARRAAQQFDRRRAAAELASIFGAAP